MTRRETMVRYLREENGFSSEQLKAAFAVPGVTDLLARVQSEGISNSELADRFVAFKEAGNSGLQNAVAAVNAELDGPEDDGIDDAFDAVISALLSLRDRISK